MFNSKGRGSMRARKCVMFGALAFAAIGMASGAYATISSTFGDALLIAPPPSVGVGELESDQNIFVFDEQQCVRLDRDVRVDLTQPGKYDDQEDLEPTSIPAGTLVSSQFMHVDSRTGRPGHPKFYTGGIVTDSDILGVIILRPKLNKSDFLGAPGTIYPNKLRQLNLFVHDYVKLESDLRTLELHVGNHLHTDHVRVLTAC